MKFIQLQKKENIYEAKALIEVKVFNFHIYNKIKEFKRNVSEDLWIATATGKEATPYESLKLDKWLGDHQRFIESD